MKINLGCGDRYAEGWLNADLTTMPHRKDQVVDLREPLPWPPQLASRIYAGHVLEHIPLFDCRRLLPRLREVLKIGGELMIVGPDVDVAWEMARAGTLDVTLDSLRYGADRWGGDHHEWECTERQLLTLLTDAGFTDVTSWDVADLPREGWPVADPRPRWQCALVGVRSEL